MTVLSIVSEYILSTNIVHSLHCILYCIGYNVLLLYKCSMFTTPRLELDTPSHILGCLNDSSFTKAFMPRAALLIFFKCVIVSVYNINIILHFYFFN